MSQVNPNYDALESLIALTGLEIIPCKRDWDYKITLNEIRDFVLTGTTYNPIQDMGTF